MSSIRKSIKDRLLAALQSVTPAAGYHSTIAGVSGTFRSIEQVASFPHVAVIDGEQSTRPGMEDDSLLEGELSFGIIGCVKPGAGEQLSESCGLLIEDIRRVLRVNLAAILADVEAGSLRLITDEILPDEMGGTGYVAVFVSFGFIEPNQPE